MISAPHTYSEWVKVLASFKEKTDDENVLAAMKNGTLEWQSGVADRFSKRFIESVNYRMDNASDKFQRDLSRAYGSESAIIQALLSLRKEMRYLVQAVDVQVFPENYRKQYVQMVIEQANTMQNSLEDSARKDRSGKMSSIVRNHKVNSI